MQPHAPITHTGKALVSSKGQVVIPQSLRRAMGIGAGTELIFSLREDGSCDVQPAKISVDLLVGLLHIPGAKPMSARDMDKAIMEAVAADDERIMRAYRKKPKKKK